MRRRVLLVMPTATYRAAAFLRACDRLDLEPILATEEPAAVPRAGAQLLINLSGGRPAPPLALAALLPIHAVVGVDEASVLAAAVLAAQLGVPANPPEAALATRDKTLLRRLLSQSGLPQPRWATWRPGKPAPDVGLPCVVKPKALSASFGVIRADTRDQEISAGERVRRLLAERGLEGDGELLVESFVPGPEIAVEGLLRDGELVPLAVYDKPVPLNGPYFEESVYQLPSRLAAADQGAVVEVLAAAATGLGLRHGAIHAEFRLGTGSPTLIDLASRSIGGRCSSVLHFASGATLEELVLLNALGDPLPDTRLDPEPSGVLMLSAPIAGRLTNIEGRERALAVPGVVGLEITAVPGAVVGAAPASDRYLGFVFASASTTGAVHQALLGAREELKISIAP